MNKAVLLSTIAVLATLPLIAEADYQAQIDALNTKIKKLEKDQKRTKKTLTEVKIHDAFDNIKFGADYRVAVDSLYYKDEESGNTAQNPSLLSSRLYLSMMAAPSENLTFRGKLAVYSLWGAHIYDESTGLKDWSASSKATDTVMRIKEAYFLYSNSIGEQPVSFSVGRRPSTEGFLANFRDNEVEPGSPLAHITNMEVTAAMAMLNFSRFVEGSYVKFVYGRAHTGEVANVYGVGSTSPFAPYADVTSDIDDESVDFFVMPAALYNDGTYNVMGQWAHIFNTKGKRLSDGTTKAASGYADLFALGVLMSGVSDANDFLWDTSIFASFAATQYTPKDGYSLMGSEDVEMGTSYWVGATFPDLITDGGKFGVEYNHGSKYWTPMTWAEDTAMGSKIAVRGDAYEAYWNFKLFGEKYLPAQIRYTYAQHDYTPNVKCAGWVTPNEVDMSAQDLRISISYKY